MITQGVVARGVSWVALGHVVSQICWFGSLLILAARVAPAAFGGVAIAMVAVQVAWLLVGSGTRASFVVAPALTRGQVQRALAINLATGLGIALAVFAAPAQVLDVVAPGADPAVLRGLACSIVLLAASIVPLALLQKAMRFKPLALTTALAALVASLGSIVAVLLGAGVWALVARQVAFQGLLALLAWTWARDLVPDRGDPGASALRPPGAGAFFTLALISFAALNVDNVVISHLGEVSALGLYALAFTLAFAPMTQIAWQIGKVMFPAAALSDADVVGARALRALRVTAVLIVPLAPIAIMLAPALVPALLGDSWQGMVVVLQLLLVVGTVHALMAILREFLLGAGGVRTCVWIEAIWLAATVLLLVPAVALDGVTGAALVHLALVVPLVAAYMRWGLPQISVGVRELWVALRPVALVATLEGAAAVAGLLAARSAGLQTSAAWLAGALAATCAALGLCATLGRTPLREGLAALRSRPAAGELA